MRDRTSRMRRRHEGLHACLGVRFAGAAVLIGALVVGCNSPITTDDATSIRGVVLDRGTGQPIENARVFTAPVTDEDLTNADGDFELSAGVRLNRLYRVTAALDGYAPETLDITPRVDREAELTFRLPLLTVCTPGAVRCAQGDQPAFETCADRGQLWDLTLCGPGQICSPANPGCTPGRTLTVTSVGGLVISNPAGISCNPTCTATFPDGTAVTLTAQPFQDAELLGWTGACADRGQEPTCPLTLTSELEVGVEFSQSTYPLRLDFRGDGAGEVRLEGRRDEQAVIDTCRADCTVRFDRETSVALTATPDGGSEFDGWDRDCSGGSPTCTVTLDAPAGADVRARFELPRRALTVSRAGTGAGRVTSAPEGIDCGSTCSSDFVLGTTVTLTATPEAGSELTGWTGDCESAGTNPTCELTLDDDRTATATFDGQAFLLTVTTDGDGSGTVTSSPSGIDCGSDCTESFGVGQTVTLTANPGPGQAFSTWSGDCSGAELTCEVTLDQDRTVNATFDVDQEDVTVSVTGGGRVVSDPAAIDCPGTCTAAFARGGTVELTATPNAGQAVASWSGVCSGSGRGSTCSFTVAGSETIDVDFTDFYRVPLAADMACRTLLRFDAAARLQDACGGGTATEVGAWSAVASRQSALADAYATSAEGDALDLSELLAAPPRATVEMTVRRTGASLGDEAYGLLWSDRDRAAPGPGLELRAFDNGRLSLTTWTSSVSFSTVETATGTLPASTWAHVAAVVEPSRLELFVDGASVARSTASVQWTASSSTAVVGATRDGAGFTDTLQGEIDEVRSSNVARY